MGGVDGTVVISIRDREGKSEVTDAVQVFITRRGSEQERTYGGFAYGMP